VARSVNSSAKVRFEYSYVWLPPKLPLMTRRRGSLRADGTFFLIASWD
jgi:hypothetical protein